MKENVIGHVHYDGRVQNNDEVSFLVQEADCERVGRNKYVKVIAKVGTKKKYIGRISAGPGARPRSRRHGGGPRGDARWWRPSNRRPRQAHRRRPVHPSGRARSPCDRHVQGP